MAMTPSEVRGTFERLRGEALGEGDPSEAQVYATVLTWLEDLGAVFPEEAGRKYADLSHRADAEAAQARALPALSASSQEAAWYVAATVLATACY